MDTNNQLDMQNQWDEIARQNAFFGVDSVPEFENSAVDESLFWQRGRKAVDQFLETLKMSDTSKLEMVEIGCGLGRMTHRFSEKFGRVYAFDISQVMLDKARSRWGHLPNVEFILGTGTDLSPLKYDSVDFVFSYIVLQHVLDESVVLNYIRESGRVLRPNGIAFLQFRTFTPSVNRRISLRNTLLGFIPRSIKDFLKKVFRYQRKKKKSSCENTAEKS